MYRRGIVRELDEKGVRARVEFEDKDGVASWWLNVNQPAASKSQVYAMPDIGAQVNCLVDGRAEEGCIIGSLYSDEDKPPITDGKHVHGKMEGGLVYDYDRSTGQLTLSTPAGMDIKAIKLKIVGDVEIDGNLDVNGGTIRNKGVDVGSEHRHKDVMTGGGQSGGPVS